MHHKQRLSLVGPLADNMQSSGSYRSFHDGHIPRDTRGPRNDSQSLHSWQELYSSYNDTCQWTLRVIMGSHVSFIILSPQTLTNVDSSYIVLGEVSNSRVKEKTSNLAVSISVLTTFVVSFTVPYLINAPYANLGARVGFIYGGITLLSVIVGYFYVPELTGRSLEEVNRLFAIGRPVRHLHRILLIEDRHDSGVVKR